MPESDPIDWTKDACYICFPEGDDYPDDYRDDPADGEFAGGLE